MRFSRWLFWLAGIYGVVALAPLYFLEQKIGDDYPPPISHPEFFYGMLGVGLAWQIAFLVMAHDPPRFRPLMIPAALEKFGFGIAVVVMFVHERVPAVILAAGIVDLVLGVLFLVAWRRLGAK